VRQDLVHEVLGRAPLALQPALHVGHAHENGVDLTGVDELPQLFDGQQALGVSHRHPFKRIAPDPLLDIAT
jgi:hypothetical protein